MMRTLLTGLIGAAAALAGAAVLAAPASKAQRDWTRVVAATPEGFRMGNPQAPVRVVEYGSLTCVHCAAFADQGAPPLVQDYVKSGRVSFEFRPYVLDPYDMAASLLSRCAAPAAYFGFVDQLFATQWKWTSRFTAMSKAQIAQLTALPESQRFVKIASLAGLDTLAARHGIPAAKAKLCLSDKKGVARLAAIRAAATDKYKIDGTPTFLVNGVPMHRVENWGELEPLLQPRGG